MILTFISINAWSAMLTHSYVHKIAVKSVAIQNPITYEIGLFHPKMQLKYMQHEKV